MINILRKVKRMSNYRDILEAYLKTLDIKADRVLDVGGAALPVKGRVKSFDVKEYDILDLPNYDLNYRFTLTKQSVDIVFCLEVMEYIFNPFIAIENLGRLLVDGGILYITFQFLYPVHNPKEADYMRYTKQGAIKLLNEEGFKILKVIPRTMTPEGQVLIRQFRIAEGMHAAKGVVHNELGVIIKAQKL